VEILSLYWEPSYNFYYDKFKKYFNHLNPTFSGRWFHIRSLRSEDTFEKYMDRTNSQLGTVNAMDIKCRKRYV